MTAKLETPAQFEQTTAVGLKIPGREELRSIPAAYRRREFLDALPFDAWRRVLELCAIDVHSTPGEAFHDALSRTLNEPQPASLIDALECIAELGTGPGMERFFDLEEQLDPVLPNDFPLDVSVAEQALHLWCAAVLDPALAARLAIARSMVLAKGGQRAAIHFPGNDARKASWTRPVEARLRRSLNAILERRSAGTYLDLVCVPDDTLLRVYVVRGAPLRSVVTVNPTGNGRDLTQFRPVVSDIATYDSSTGRLTLQVDSRHMAKEYRGAFGTGLFGDAEFFAGMGGWTLTPLQQKGREALVGGLTVSRVAAVTLRSFTWCPRDGERVQLASENAFDLIERHRLPIQQGDIVEAKFQFLFHAVGRRARATVTVRPPNVVRADERHRDDVERHLESLGFFKPKAETIRDLWWAGDRALDDHAWRTVLGMDPNAARSLGWLVPAPLRRVARDPGDEFDPETLPVEPNVPSNGSATVAYSEDGDARHVRMDELQGSQLNAPQLAASIAHALGIQDAPTVLCPEILDLGVHQVGSVPVRVLLAHRQPAPNPMLLHAQRRGRELPVVLAPPGRALEGCTMIPIASLLNTSRLAGAIVRALGLEAEVPAIVYAPEGVRLVVDCERGKVWLDGVDLELTEGQFDFARDVAIGTLRQNPTPTKQIAERVGSVRQADSGGRQMKLQFLKRVRDAFAKHDRPPPSVDGDQFIRSAARGRGYVFTVIPFVPRSA